MLTSAIWPASTGCEYGQQCIISGLILLTGWAVCWACSGEPIPRIEYTPDEVAVWGTVLPQLKELIPRHACKEVRHMQATCPVWYLCVTHLSLCDRGCCC